MKALSLQDRSSRHDGCRDIDRSGALSRLPHRIRGSGPAAAPRNLPGPLVPFRPHAVLLARNAAF
jgi:hypothetical protein